MILFNFVHMSRACKSKLSILFWAYFYRQLLNAMTPQKSWIVDDACLGLQASPHISDHLAAPSGYCNLSKWTCLVNLPSSSKSNLCYTVGSVSIPVALMQQILYPDSLTQMYSSSMIYGSLNRSYPRFIHIRVECTLLQKSFFV